jgi:hypothetical protein
VGQEEKNFFLRRTNPSILLKIFLIVVVGAVEMWKTQKNLDFIRVTPT